MDIQNLDIHGYKSRYDIHNEINPISHIKDILTKLIIIYNNILFLLNLHVVIYYVK
jgi:hypothetical protein